MHYLNSQTQKLNEVNNRVSKFKKFINDNNNNTTHTINNKKSELNTNKKNKIKAKSKNIIDISNNLDDLGIYTSDIINNNQNNVDLFEDDNLNNLLEIERNKEIKTNNKINKSSILDNINEKSKHLLENKLKQEKISTIKETLQNITIHKNKEELEKAFKDNSYLNKNNYISGGITSILNSNRENVLKHKRNINKADNISDEYNKNISNKDDDNNRIEDKDNFNNKNRYNRITSNYIKDEINKQEQIDKENKKILNNEPLVLKGVYNALCIMKARGYLDDEEFVGKLKQNPFKLDILNKNKGEINIEHRDEMGRIMTQKHAHKYYSEQFQGKSKGKNKKEKQKLRDQLYDRCKNKDINNSLFSMALLRKYQTDNKTPGMSLTNKNN